MSWRKHRLSVVVCALGAAVVWLNSPARGGDPTAQVQAHLGAGEFGPARAAAAGVGDAGQRDALLADIAAAQAGAGAKAGSLNTAYDITSDVTRQAALARVADRFFGARGGGAMADFDTLIELITTTISPQTWDEVGG